MEKHALFVMDLADQGKLSKFICHLAECRLCERLSGARGVMEMVS